MNKISPKVLALVAVLALILGLSGCCSMVKSCLQQVLIINQPQSVAVYTNGNATFSVYAWQGPPFGTNGLTYQWQVNNVLLDTTNIDYNWANIDITNNPGANSPSITITNVQLSDVGFYRVIVTGSTNVRSAPAPLYVITEGTITVTGTPVAQSVTGSGCPGGYVGYVYYTPTNTSNWGWFVVNKSNQGKAKDPQSTVTKVQYLGKAGDSDCHGSGFVNIPAPIPSSQYQFYIYFTNGPPTGNYAIDLTNFQY